MQTQTVKFMSITKFVEFMKEHHLNLCGIIAYFEASDVFKNKFGKMCIKPVMLKLQKGRTRERDEYIKHQTIRDTFGGQLILSFGEGKTRFIPKDKDKLYYLVIDTNIKEWNGFNFYPSEMFQCLVEKNIKLIRKQEVKEIPPTTENAEEEIDPSSLC